MITSNWLSDWLTDSVCCEGSLLSHLPLQLPQQTGPLWPEEEPVPAEAQGWREAVRLLPAEVSQALPLGQQPQRRLRDERHLVMISGPHSTVTVTQTYKWSYLQCTTISKSNDMITIIFTGPACSLSALSVGAAIHIDCDIVNYDTIILWDKL